MLHMVVVGEKEQTLGINIKPANRVHVFWERSKILKRLMSRLMSELRQHTIRLVEENVVVSPLHSGLNVAGRQLTRKIGSLRLILAVRFSTF